MPISSATFWRDEVGVDRDREGAGDAASGHRRELATAGRHDEPERAARSKTDVSRRARGGRQDRRRDRRHARSNLLIVRSPLLLSPHRRRLTEEYPTRAIPFARRYALQGEPVCSRQYGRRVVRVSKRGSSTTSDRSFQMPRICPEGRPLRNGLNILSGQRYRTVFHQSTGRSSSGCRSPEERL